MSRSLLLDAGLLVSGVASGTLSAAFGVGGAALSTPAIRALGVPASLAVGTTLPSVIPGAVIGSVRYSRRGLVDWSTVAWATPAGLVTAVLGSFGSRVLPGGGHWLMVATAVVLGTTALRLSRVRAPADSPHAVDEARAASPRLAAVAGAAAGLLSGLLGLGGGVVLVPAFVELLRLPLHRAVATSLVCVGLFAVPSTITHAILGDIDWSVALLLTIGVLPGARLGSFLALWASEARLRRWVAAFLAIISVVYALGELLALRGGS